MRRNTNGFLKYVIQPVIFSFFLINNKTIRFSHDIKNDHTSLCRYQHQPSASVDSDKLWLDNSSYHSIIVKWRSPID